MNVGDKVNINTVIGKMGNTGNSTGTHLHLEATIKQAWACENFVNPLEPLGIPNVRGTIVKYSEDIAAFVSEALSPASVVSVEIVDEAAKSCRASVPDHQLSLAIGNKGQNARLAAKLTGWKIDIRPESGYYGE